MKRTKQIWLAAAIVTAGFLSACSNDEPPAECPDLNGNGICDTEEPGHGQCDVMDRDAQGKCPNAPPHCTGTQILVDNVCEACPAGDIAQSNVCVTPSVTCETNEIIVDDACVDCGDDATATDNQCVPHCEATQILVDNACVDCATGQINDGNNVCVADTSDDCDAGEILVDDVCCVDANENGLCDADEPGNEICPVEERDENGDCPTVCAPELENADGICTCADFDLDELCDSDPADDCFGLNNGSDADEDGFCDDTDCDDSDVYTYPGAPEICGLQAVNDCDNPCYDTTCDVADLAAAKEGKVGEGRYGIVMQWSDVTDDVVGAGKVYETAGNVTLEFCGAGPFLVDLQANGDDNRLNVRSGLQSGPNPVLTAEGEDRAVVSVRDLGYLALQNVNLTHKQGFVGSDGHGLFCEKATFNAFNVRSNANAAKQGGGFYANDCGIQIEGNIDLSSNKAVEGSGFFITGGSTSQSKGVALTFSENTTESDDSAALHVADASNIEWNLGPDSPTAAFRGNFDTDSKSRDIRVTSGAKLGITKATFMSSGQVHVRTDDSSYDYGAGPLAPLACDSSVCTP